MKTKLLLLILMAGSVCFAQKSPKKNKTTTFPFELTSFNNIKVKTVLNKKDTLFLTFDTGAMDFYLTKEAIKKYLNPKGLKLTMKDISDNHFNIANIEWEHQQIYPIETTGQQTEGMFGWNMFEGKILEIDYDKSLMTVHNELPKISRQYSKFVMETGKEHFFINIDIQNGKTKYRSKYLFDTGFQKAAMLDNDVLAKMNFPTNQLEVLKTTILHNSNNDEIPFKTVNIQKLVFGKYVLENVPSELNTNKNPAGFETNHLGSDVLKRFNIILDFQQKIIYLKPNKHFKDPYFDQKA